MLNRDLEIELKREVYTHSYFEFFKFAFRILHPTEPFRDAFHVKYLCDRLQEEAERVLKNVQKNRDIIINIPPRASKSLITSIAFLPWVWIRDPSSSFITVSYDAQLSLINSQMCRDIIRDEEYQLLFGTSYQIRADTDGKELFKNNKGGARLSKTTGSNITGHKAKYIVVDDPENAKTAASKADRESLKNYYNNALFNRLTPADLGVRIIVQQRLHQDDLTGYLLTNNPDSYEHICLPAENTDVSNIKPEYLINQYKNGLLDPIRLNHFILNSFKKTLGSKGYAGQYGQSPKPDEGNIFKKEWFDIIDPNGLTRDIEINPIHFYIDTAYTEDTENDPSAIVTCYFKDNMVYILDAREVWLTFPDLCKFLTEHVNKYQYSARHSKIRIEPKASGLSVAQSLRSTTMLNIVDLPSPKDSKVTRANSITAICESRRVKMISGAYIDKFMDQLTTFPNAVHDDMVDTLVYAVIDLTNQNVDFAFLE